MNYSSIGNNPNALVKRDAYLPSVPAAVSSFEQKITTSAHQSLAEMPLMGFGTYIGIENKKIENISDRLKATENAIFNALKEGYRHLDTAVNYGNLAAIGNAIKRARLPESQGGLGLKREDIWVTLKGAPTGRIQSSLKELGIEYVDLYLIHHPTCFNSKNELLDAWKAVDTLVKEGQAKKIGVSNFYKNHLERLIALCDEYRLVKPYANQIELHLYQQENELAEFCQSQNIKTIAYSPLGYANIKLLLDNETLQHVATNIQATPAQTALAYTLSRGIAVIPCSTTVDHMKENRVAMDIIRKISTEHKTALAGCDWNCSMTDTSAQFKEAAGRITW